MKKQRDTKNIRPAKEVCAKCKVHGICIAETGAASYQCVKVLGKEVD